MSAKRQTMEPIEIVELNESDAERLIAPSIADWEAVARRMQILSWDVLRDAGLVTDKATAPSPQLAAHYLCARLNDDLRSVVTLVQRGFVFQALSLDAGMLELAFAVGWIGKDTDLGNDWLDWKKGWTAPQNVRIAIDATLRNGGKPFTKADVGDEYAHYTRLCQLKHGNPYEKRQYGMDLDFRGIPNRFAADELSPDFINASRWALWFAVRYDWLAVYCYNDFHAIPPHHSQRSQEMTQLRIDIAKIRHDDVHIRGSTF